MFMERISEATNSLLAKVILGLVAVSFVLSGVAGYMFTRSDTFAAKVNGDEISQQLFQQRYDQAYQSMSDQLGERFAVVADSPEFIKNLKANVLNGLIDQTLLRQYIEELKLGISNEQIKVAIVQDPMFQKDGKFDNTLYQRLLSENGLTGDMFAYNVRQNLKTEQLQNGIFASSFVTPKQIENIGKNIFQQRDVRLANFPINPKTDESSVTEQEIKAYYDTHQDQFSLPETVNIQYIDLTHKEAAAQVKVTDVEIAQYYQDNKMQYLTQHLAHIQVPTKEEADRLYTDLENGANFSELAQEFSTDKISAKNGGDLDWVTAGMMPSTFEKAALSLKVGQYSHPIKVDNSYHIIKVEAEKVLPLDEVKTAITNKLRNELSVNKFYAMEKVLNEKAFESQDSLEPAAKAIGLAIHETGYFSKNDVPAAINYGNVMSAIFDTDLLQGTMNSEAMNVGDQHSIVVRVLDHKQARIQTLAEVKEKIIQELSYQKAQAAEFNHVEKMVKELTAGTLSADNVAFGNVEHWNYLAKHNPELTKAIFAMPIPQDKPVYIAIKDNAKQSIVIVELSKVVTGKLDSNKTQQLGYQLNQLQQQNLDKLLLKALRKQGTIEVNQEFMNDTQN